MDNTGVLYFSSLEGKTAKASAKDAKSGGEGKESKDEKKEEPKEESDFSLVYSSSFTEGKGWDKPAALGELINRVGYHTANVSFSKDGNTMYFTRTISDGGHMEESKVYVSTRTATDWSPALEVKGVNGDYLVRHPVEGELYGSKVLVFSANIPGGKGGFDLYYSNKISDTEFSAPVSLASLNTPGDDICPFMHEGTMFLVQIIGQVWVDLIFLKVNGMDRIGQHQKTWGFL